MKINIYDEDLKRISIVADQFISCLWEEGFNTTGSFTLELQKTDEYKRKIRPNYYVGRDDRKTMMVIKSVVINKNTIVASGKTADRILDDVAFIGTIEEGQKIDETVFLAYNKSNKYRQLDFAETHLGVSNDHQISNVSFQKLCQTMSREADLGFKVVRSGNKLIATFYKPIVNEKAIFSEKYGNLILNALTLSTENEKNYAIVLGEGEDANRKKEIVDFTNGDDRREIIIDARDIQKEDEETDTEYQKRLFARGVEKLLEHQKTWECAINISDVDFGDKFDLGDICKVLLTDYGIKLNAKISKFSQKEQKNKIETTIRVGNITIVR